MSALPIRSPHERVGGLVYFGRMLDNPRLHARGQLPPEYVGRLGKALDDRCCELLGVKYEELKQAVLAGWPTMTRSCGAFNKGGVLRSRRCITLVRG